MLYLLAWEQVAAILVAQADEVDRQAQVLYHSCHPGKRDVLSIHPVVQDDDTALQMADQPGS